MTATQLYFGAREADAFSPSDVESAIAAARETAGIDALLIWPCGEHAVTERFVQACISRGVQAYLWFPVLADVPGVPAGPQQLVEASDGRRGNGTVGAWERLESGDERFLFSCPNNEEFVDRVFTVFSSLLDRLPVGGVMLDRIRFPSASNGFEALFTCFCSRCVQRFLSETGHPLSAQKDRAASFLQRLRNLTAASFAEEWRATDSLWTVSGLAELSAFRARSVTRVVERFALHARGRGLRVGLDLFSPSLCGLVSQDYQALAPSCDWIKPMLYCHARGPAGLPLEVESLRRALVTLCPGLGRQDATRILAEFFHLEIPESGSLPLETISHELDMIDRMQLPLTVEVLAGLEAVRIPHFGIDVSADALAEALSRVHGRCRGVVASWNLLHIPKENLRRIAAMKSREGAAWKHSSS